MRYYVEINGESSLDIQGLMIQSLPSISKPLIRSKQETIDGRDGDIITKLGYGAYDKTLKIGLWGNYDINEVIAFFNQEGTITFSNEPDKYYKFTILNREDYVSQLDKFRTATIMIHCQPFKYKLNEEAEEIENEYTTQEGTNLTFNNSLVAPMNIDLKGNTLQNGTPTPSSPIPINNVSGDNQVNVCGKNLWKFLSTDYYNNQNISSWNILSLDKLELTSTNGTYANVKYKLNLPNGTYTFKLGKVTNTNSNMTKKRMTLAQYIGTNISVIQHIDEGNSYTINIDNSQNDFYCIEFWATYETAMINTATFEEIQIEQGNQTTTYEAYTGTTYNIDLPVENLFDKDNATNGVRIGGNGADYTDANYFTSEYIKVAPNTTYTIKKDSVSQYNAVALYTQNKGFISRSDFYTTTTYTFTTNANTYYIRVCDTNDNINSLKVGNGTEITDYAIELNKIGNYQDYIYKENDKWYLHKETGKYTFTGDETFTLQNSNKRAHILNTNNQLGDILKTTGGTGILYGMYSNKLEEKTANQTWTGTQGISYDYNSGANQEDIDISINGLTTIDQYKSAINGITMYFILNTPTNTEITYTNLIEQLESIKNAMSKEGTTNVNQVNNDLPFIINASVLTGTDSITITNEGNTTSKPILNITGSGVVGVYLENIQMFNITLGTNETIIIDTENMEAYYGSQLKNRQVTGDYSNFALQRGTNNLKFTGLITNVEITNYNRWI